MCEVDKIYFFDTGENQQFDNCCTRTRLLGCNTAVFCDIVRPHISATCRRCVTLCGSRHTPWLAVVYHQAARQIELSNWLPRNFSLDFRLSFIAENVHNNAQLLFPNLLHTELSNKFLSLLNIDRFCKFFHCTCGYLMHDRQRLRSSSTTMIVCLFLPSDFLLFPVAGACIWNDLGLPSHITSSPSLLTLK